MPVTGAKATPGVRQAWPMVRASPGPSREGAARSPNEASPESEGSCSEGQAALGSLRALLVAPLVVGVRFAARLTRWLLCPLVPSVRGERSAWFENAGGTAPQAVPVPLLPFGTHWLIRW